MVDDFRSVALFTGGVRLFFVTAVDAVPLESEEEFELDNLLFAAAEEEEENPFDRLFVVAVLGVEEEVPFDNRLAAAVAVTEELDNLLFADEVEVFEDVDAFENRLMGEFTLDRLAKVERTGILGP